MQDELFLGSINFCFFIFLITCFCTNRHADNGIKGGLVSCKHDGVTHSVTIVSGTFTHFLTYMRQQLCSWNQRVEFTAAYDAQASDSCTHNCPPPQKNTTPLSRKQPNAYPVHARHGEGAFLHLGIASVTHTFAQRHGASKPPSFTSHSVLQHPSICPLISPSFLVCSQSSSSSTFSQGEMKAFL